MALHDGSLVVVEPWSLWARQVDGDVRVREQVGLCSDADRDIYSKRLSEHLKMKRRTALESVFVERGIDVLLLRSKGLSQATRFLQRDPMWNRPSAKLLQDGSRFGHETADQVP
jgi:hypothetical protein